MFNKRFTLAVIIFIVLAGCAVMQTPEGGPRDYDSPNVLNEVPINKSTNLSKGEIEIFFDEYINLQDAYTEITVSPEINPPLKIKSKPDRIIIELNDSLRPNTTYSVNFGKSIKDVTEANELLNYKYVFSTGDYVDSLKLSGQVFYSIDSTQYSKVLVGLYPTDTVPFYLRKPVFYSYTDKYGEFSIENIKEGKYNIYAIKDLNSDKLPDEEELLAFLNDTITLYKENKDHVDLIMSKQVPLNLRILDNRYYEGKINIKLNAPEDTLYFETVYPTTWKDSIIVDRVTSDSLYLWLPSVKFDSTQIIVCNNHTWQDTITVRNFIKEPKMKLVSISDNMKDSKLLRPGDDFKIQFSRLVKDLDKSKIKILEDTLKREKFEVIQNPENLREYIIDYKWDSTKTYTISINQNELLDFYGNYNDKYSKKFNVDSASNYGTVIIDFIIPEGKQYLAQILTEKNIFLAEGLVEESRLYEFKMVKPGKYMIRYIEDSNKNGIWDLGDARKGIQPEKVTYFRDLIQVRKNWDIEIPIDVEENDIAAEAYFYEKIALDKKKEKEREEKRRRENK